MLVGVVNEAEGVVGVEIEIGVWKRLARREMVHGVLGILVADRRCLGDLARWLREVVRLKEGGSCREIFLIANNALQKRVRPGAIECLGLSR